MLCKDCEHFEEGYVNAKYGARDCGMRNYGYGICRLKGLAVYELDEGCRGKAACADCIRRHEIYLRGESGEYIFTGHRVCGWLDADVSKRKKHCALYLPEKLYDGADGGDKAEPKLPGLIERLGARFSIGLYNLLRRTRRLRLRLRRLFGE